MARAKRESKKGAGSKGSQGDSPRREQSESQQPDTGKRNISGNQGEGNREADRRYREGASTFERSGRVAAAAEEARRAVEREDDEGAQDDDTDVGDVIDFEDYDDDEERANAEESRREARDRSRLS